jgi:hypothetical protein
VVPLLLALAYLALLLGHWGPGGFGSLAEVRQLFEQPGAAGRRLAALPRLRPLRRHLDGPRRGAARRRRTWLVVPCLALTFLFGPAGLLAYARPSSCSHERIPMNPTVACPATCPGTREPTADRPGRGLWRASRG